MSDEGTYRDGQAMWAAVTHQARRTAREQNLEPSVVPRRFVQQRFLARVFHNPDEPWVLKGGTAVLMRVHDARTTKDVDLLNELDDIEAALTHLLAAAALDLGDHFRFMHTSTEVLQGGVNQPNVSGRTVRFDAYCGASRKKDTIKVDLVTGSLMTTAPEVRVDEILAIPGFAAPAVRVYPLVDHIADKLCATQARYGVHGERASSRTRDLVDLIVLARSGDIDGAALATAIRGEWTHRGLDGDPFFDPPADWAAAYPGIARGVPKCVGLRRYRDAVAWVQAFLGPALDGMASGLRWSSVAQSWD